MGASKRERDGRELAASRRWTLLGELAAQLGVEVRLERLECDDDIVVRSGLCRLGPRLVAFVDRRATQEAKNRQLGRALADLDLDAVYVRPALRAYLDELAGRAPARDEADFE